MSSKVREEGPLARFSLRHCWRSWIATVGLLGRRIYCSPPAPRIDRFATARSRGSAFRLGRIPGSTSEFRRTRCVTVSATHSPEAGTGFARDSSAAGTRQSQDHGHLHICFHRFDRQDRQPVGYFAGRVSRSGWRRLAQGSRRWRPRELWVFSMPTAIGQPPTPTPASQSPPGRTSLKVVRTFFAAKPAQPWRDYSHRLSSPQKRVYSDIQACSNGSHAAARPSLRALRPSRDFA